MWKFLFVLSTLVILWVPLHRIIRRLTKELLKRSTTSFLAALQGLTKLGDALTNMLNENCYPLYLLQLGHKKAIENIIPRDKICEITLPRQSAPINTARTTKNRWKSKCKNGKSRVMVSSFTDQDRRKTPMRRLALISFCSSSKKNGSRIYWGDMAPTLCLWTLPTRRRSTLFPSFSSVFIVTLATKSLLHSSAKTKMLIQYPRLYQSSSHGTLGGIHHISWWIFPLQKSMRSSNSFPIRKCTSVIFTESRHGRDGRALVKMV